MMRRLLNLSLHLSPISSSNPKTVLPVSLFSNEKIPPKSPTIFDSILSKQIPSSPVYEDDKIYAFRDINPTAKTHILIIPKKKQNLTGISQAEEKNVQILGYMLWKAKEIADKQGISQDGYRIVINQGKNGQQTVKHLHMHLIGGRPMKWPPG